MDLKIFDRMESEVRGYIRSFPVIFSQARASTLIDEEGTEYIDFFSGAGTLNYGHNNPVLKEKLLDYVRADGVVHGLDMATSAKKAFLKTVDRVLPSRATGNTPCSSPDPPAPTRSRRR